MVCLWYTGMPSEEETWQPTVQFGLDSSFDPMPIDHPQFIHCLMHTTYKNGWPDATSRSLASVQVMNKMYRNAILNNFEDLRLNKLDFK